MRSALTRTCLTADIASMLTRNRWVIKVNDYYYMTYTTSDNITILRSSVLT